MFKKPLGSEKKRGEKLLGGKETLLARLNGTSLEKNPRIVIARSNISQMLKEAQNNAHAYLYLQKANHLVWLFHQINGCPLVAAMGTKATPLKARTTLNFYKNEKNIFST